MSTPYDDLVACQDQSTKYFTKDPNAVLDFELNWNREGDPWLVPGDTIETSTWTISPADSTLTQPTDATNTTTTATVWLGAGTVGVRYEVVNHIVTAQGRIEDQSIFVTIVEH